MPRKLLERSPFFPYHLCARSNNQEWFKVPMPHVYEVYMDQCKSLSEKFRFEIHGFILMSNHFHMLVSTPKANIDKGMQSFMTTTSRQIARLSGRINKIYGARYHWTLIRSSEHFAHTYRYIYQNPIRAGIVDSVFDYPWSTLQPLQEEQDVFITRNKNGFDEYIPKLEKEFVDWIDQSFGVNHDEAVRKALRKHNFKFPRTASGYKPSHFNTLLRKNTTGT